MYNKTPPQLHSVSAFGLNTRRLDYNRKHTSNALHHLRWRAPKQDVIYFRIRRKLTTRVSLSDIPTLPDEISHAVINFTLLYSTMNWLYYRGIRKRMEEKDKNK